MTEAPHDPFPVESLYLSLLSAWNARDAAAIAACFSDAARMIGFDGSEITGRANIESHLAPIFAHHPTPTYVSNIREIRFLTGGVAVLHAVVGMVPRGKTDLNPALNATQTLVAHRHGDRWLIESFQNPPAADHGRPEMVEQLTQELRQLLSPKP
jgi:uncharacterized protein (TIGR02246 family)